MNKKRAPVSECPYELATKPFTFSLTILKRQGVVLWFMVYGLWFIV